MVNYHINGGKVLVTGIENSAEILDGGVLSERALEMLRNAEGQQVTILINYTRSTGKSFKTALVFYVK